MADGYVDLEYEPEGNDIECLFYVEPVLGVSFERACEAVAGESSIGTWTDVSTMSSQIRDRLKPSVFELNEQEKTIKIAYPLELFEEGNIPQLLSSVAGNIFGMKALSNLRLVDIKLPEAYVKSFKGPLLGRDGVRKLLNIKKRPLVGTIVKPKVGLDPEKWSEAAKNALEGGCDFIKDDENLTSQEFCKFEERVDRTLKIIEKMEKKSVRRMGYSPNITAKTDVMVERAEYIKDHGGRYMMIDVLTVGFSALQYMREQNIGLAIHAHRAMHAAVTRNKKHGISMLVLAKLLRLAGCDQLHIGTVVGKMEGSLVEVKSIRDEMLGDAGWHDTKPVLPVCSGGLHPALIPELIEIMGSDIVIQAGGGVYGHPDGPRAGAKAMRQAVDATLQKIPLETYSKDHVELKRALEKFGRQ